MNLLKELIDGLREVFRKPEASHNKVGLGDLRFFFQFVKPVWKLGVLSLALAVFITGIRAVIPLSSKVFIDFVVMKTGFDSFDRILSFVGLGAYSPAINGLLSSLDVVIVSLFVLGVVYGLLQVVQGYLMTRYQQELTFNLQTKLFDHVLRFPMSFFKDKQTGYLMSRVSDDVDMLQYLFSSVISQIISNSLYIVFGLGILLTLSPTMALVIIIMLPVYLFVNYFFSARMRALSYKERERHAELEKDMQEVLSSVEVVKAYSAEDKEVEKVSGRLRNIISVRINTTILSSFSSSIMSGVQFVLLLMIMWLGVRQIQGGALTVGDLVSFVAYALFLTGALYTLFYTYLSFQPLLASMDRLKEMFSIIPEYEKGKTLIMPEKVSGNIRFDNVSFAYKERETVLKGLNFEVKPGETVALVGPSGAGKTTLVNLLLKFYTPSEGAVFLDGRDLKEIDTAWLRKQISIVSQDIFLFNDSIENNIKYGDRDASHEAVVEAARKAHILDDIVKLPEGFDTLIGERGVKLSGGQRQRISMARAFLKDTPLMILDEPTSAIDVGTESLIKASLIELIRDKTTVIISHRITLTEISDLVIVIENGRISSIEQKANVIIKNEKGTATAF